MVILKIIWLKFLFINEGDMEIPHRKITLFALRAICTTVDSKIVTVFHIPSTLIEDSTYRIRGVTHTVYLYGIGCFSLGNSQVSLRTLSKYCFNFIRVQTELIKFFSCSRSYFRRKDEIKGRQFLYVKYVGNVFIK